MCAYSFSRKCLACAGLFDTVYLLNLLVKKTSSHKKRDENRNKIKENVFGKNFVTCFSTLCGYSRVHISSDEVFSKILKKSSIVQKKIMPHMKAFGIFNKMK